MDTPQIKAGENNDPSVEVGTGNVEVVTPQFREAMSLLGFVESEGSFVYNSGGRAIWINPSSPELSEDVTKQIITQAEAIGSRTKINELRKALDLPFGVVDVLQPAPLWAKLPHEH
jgi:hypothetical protein